MGAARQRSRWRQGCSIDSNGDVWAVTPPSQGAEDPGINYVVRLRPSTNELTGYAIPTVNGNPSIIAAGDGYIGISEGSGSTLVILTPNGTPFVVTPTAGTATRTTISAVATPVALAAPTNGVATETNVDVEPTLTGDLLEVKHTPTGKDPAGIDAMPDLPGSFYFLYGARSSRNLVSLLPNSGRGTVGPLPDSHWNCDVVGGKAADIVGQNYGNLVNWGVPSRIWSVWLSLLLPSFLLWPVGHPRCRHPPTYALYPPGTLGPAHDSRPLVESGGAVHRHVR